MIMSPARSLLMSLVYKDRMIMMTRIDVVAGQTGSKFKRILSARIAPGSSLPDSHGRCRSFSLQVCIEESAEIPAPGIAYIRAEGGFSGPACRRKISREIIWISRRIFACPNISALRRLVFLSPSERQTV